LITSRLSYHLTYLKWRAGSELAAKHHRTPSALGVRRRVLGGVLNSSGGPGSGHGHGRGRGRGPEVECRGLHALLVVRGGGQIERELNGRRFGLLPRALPAGARQRPPPGTALLPPLGRICALRLPAIIIRPVSLRAEQQTPNPTKRRGNNHTEHADAAP
jgi:hypothetical protein